MRDFTWNYFSQTGDVNAYLLYKEIIDGGAREENGEEEAEGEDTESFL